MFFSNKLFFNKNNQDFSVFLSLSDECSDRADIVMVVDSSSSITWDDPTNWNYLKVGNAVLNHMNQKVV